MLKMNGNWIKLHRQILDSEVFASQKMLKIWVWCLCKANHKMNFVPIKKGKGEMTVKLKRGEFLFGRFRAEEELFIDGSTIYKIMKKLEQLGNIMVKSNNHYSIVSICNYDQYQTYKDTRVTAKEQLTDSKVTAKSQLSNTDKTDNNDKKEYTHKQFYELEKEIANGKYKDRYFQFIEFLYGKNDMSKPLNKALELKDQVSFDNFCKLMDKIGIINNKKGEQKVLLTEKLKSMYNSPGLLKGKVSLYLTLNNWINREG